MKFTNKVGPLTTYFKYAACAWLWVSAFQHLPAAADLPNSSTQGVDIGNVAYKSNASVVGDVDNDGDFDFISGNGPRLDGGGTVASKRNKLYLNDGSGDFPATGTDISSDGDGTYSLALGDVDGDGYLDLVVGNVGETNKLYLNNGSGGFASTGTDIGSDTDSTDEVVLGDMDGDGDLDLVAGTRNGPSKLYLNNGSGFTTDAGTVFGSESDTTRSVVVADVDLDGDLDALIANFGQTNKLYRNTVVTRTVNITADVTAPVITRVGDATVSLELGSTYTDAGATAVDNTDGNITSSISTVNPVDVNTVGTYTVTYNVDDDAGNSATQVTRTVNITVDVPVITRLGDATVSLELGSTYTDSGATAVDNTDGTITSSIVTDASAVNVNTVGTYTVTYNVNDAAGNAATQVTRTVNITADVTAPVISLLGDATVSLELGSTYTDSGATAVDNIDGTITSGIATVNPVDVNTVGTYTVTYNVSDAAGNAATQITRTVNITADVTIPVIAITGSNPQRIEVGTAYSELGATAVDNIDGDITDSILIDTSAIDLDTVGTYLITYNVSDAAENAATEVTRTFEVEPVPITLVIPDDLTVNASGFITGVNLDPENVASASSGGNIVNVSSDQLGPFQSGSYVITWSATSAGRTVTQIQILKVIPQVSLGLDIVRTEGNSLNVKVFLSGKATDYPVTVPYTISGTATAGDDYTASNGVLTFSEFDTDPSIELNIVKDDVAESEETVVITLGNPTNAALGVNPVQVISIVERNLLPQVTLNVSQGDISGAIIAQDSGTAIVNASIYDPNETDNHTVDWSRALLAIPNASTNVINGDQVLELEAADLSVGVHSVEVDVSDGTETVAAAVNILVIEQTPALSATSDSDGDGRLDATEANDIDRDGIPDYLDNSALTSNVIPVGDSVGVIQAEPGVAMTLGSLSLGAGNYNVSVTEGEIASSTDGGDTAYDFIGSLFDFAMSGADPGYSYSLILPLSTGLPENAVYRKYSELAGWEDFAENATNSLSSAMSFGGACPGLNSNEYTSGLNVGDMCVRMLIEDGGSNDADGSKNGTLVDPGGVAVRYIGIPSNLSQVVLSDTELTANSTDSATITVTVLDADGVGLELMTVTGSTQIPGVVVSDFVEQGNGTYVGTVNAGNDSGGGSVSVTIDNGETSIIISSETLRINAKALILPAPSPGGGCVVATNGSTDHSLLLLLLISGLLMARRRYLKMSNVA